MKFIVITIFILSFLSCTPVTRKSYSRKKSVKVAVKGEGEKFGKQKKSWSYKRDSERYSGNSSSIPSKLDKLIRKYWGTNYKYGSTNPKIGFDCSSYVQRVYKEAFNYNLPRTSRTQFSKGHSVSKRDLRAGDLVFFKINSSRINHVGIYIKGNKFTHASVSSGVTISNLDNDYYRRSYAGARRFL
ncbi:MAG: hypothetical protein CR982_02410 [Candidatus Cloacimonadota bacterium]|nr:MAG: hypothetical protein CR982_02410 [Candidatus Cloacimonadota bacterium]PIE78544.1 MAG: hypothetical protein CSA15_07570 [Candidatus Delongbacteria bacterium]